MDDNKRHSTRVKAGFEAYVTVDDVVIPVETRDISLKGALLVGCDDCHVGTHAELHIPLSPSVRIVTEGDIIRSGDNQIAMRFKEMDELSFTFLHRLVQLNAQDPVTIDDELMDVFEKF
ncbi:Type IV pilus assembly PilZ [Pseudodesulfovibrio profundus]|uniref:Type IV pilus assembly PilZ n=1 Tax=Pseudodesulfovibrio profundus TaxID=57320 RepID=A0A2C8F9K2_9BACT|nr:PilZ domain-containing protein [Pseudodesulfovibrio profundus]MBC17819.1 pilus assembly protein PilZ [Desulfovibrio sp.]SOB59230.1 Type IV pilus assembly PilZ [Pseudodesulfovibrio profundus]|tara:strand:- start:1050 stop:1406 length:357 start_codon:yes stop_codon:yes gene_type:complete